MEKAVAKTDETKGTGRERIIQAVTTPLAFFTLAVLIVEGFLAGLAAFRLTGSDRTSAFYWMTGIIVFLIVLVATLSVVRPEALSGNRPDDGLKAENQKVNEKLRQSEIENRRLKANVEQLEHQTRALKAEKDFLAIQIEKLDSLKSRVIAVLVARGSAEIYEILGNLGIGRNTPEHNQVLTILGRLAEDGRIMRDTSKGGNYYALKS